MADVVRGRWTHAHSGDLTVFLIGMRINRWWRPDAWAPALAAMGPMLAELSQDPESGFLGYRVLLGVRGPTVVQYWRSTDDVYRYAADGDARHRPAWAAFNRRARKAPGAVGVWHETYQVARAESCVRRLPRVRSDCRDQRPAGQQPVRHRPPAPGRADLSAAVQRSRTALDGGRQPVAVVGSGDERRPSSRSAHRRGAR